MSETDATEVREIVDRLQEQSLDVLGMDVAIEEFARLVVERGTFMPDCNVTTELTLTPKERLTGKREQDVTAMLIIGMMLGSALERDVPEGGELEEVWRDGGFELPDNA